MGQRVIASTKTTAAIVEGVVAKITPSGKITVNITYERNGGGWGSLSRSFEPQSITVVDNLPPSSFPMTLKEVIDHNTKAKKLRDQNRESHTLRPQPERPQWPLSQGQFYLSGQPQTAYDLRIRQYNEAVAQWRVNPCVFCTATTQELEIRRCI